VYAVRWVFALLGSCDQAGGITSNISLRCKARRYTLALRRMSGRGEGLIQFGGRETPPLRRIGRTGPAPR
jgi:hypothetical protein